MQFHLIYLLVKIAEIQLAIVKYELCFELRTNFPQHRQGHYNMQYNGVYEQFIRIKMISSKSCYVNVNFAWMQWVAMTYQMDKVTFD